MGWTVVVVVVGGPPSRAGLSLAPSPFFFLSAPPLPPPPPPPSSSSSCSLSCLLLHFVHFVLISRSVPEPHLNFPTFFIVYSFPRLFFVPRNVSFSRFYLSISPHLRDIQRNRNDDFHYPKEKIKKQDISDSL